MNNEEGIKVYVSTNVFVHRHANDILMPVCLKGDSSNCCYRLGAEIVKRLQLLWIVTTMQY